MNRENATQLLQENDVVQSGDQFLSGMSEEGTREWLPCTDITLGRTLRSDDVGWFRRPIESQPANEQ